MISMDRYLQTMMQKGHHPNIMRVTTHNTRMIINNNRNSQNISNQITRILVAIRNSSNLNNITEMSAMAIKGQVLLWATVMITVRITYQKSSKPNPSVNNLAAQG